MLGFVIGIVLVGSGIFAAWKIFTNREKAKDLKKEQTWNP